MPNVSHVFVIVPKPTKESPTERVVPIPAREGSSAGGMPMTCTPGRVYRVAWSTYTRKRITGGDLVLTNKSGTKVANHLEADASNLDGLEIDADGAVAKLAPTAFSDKTTSKD